MNTKGLEFAKQTIGPINKMKISNNYLRESFKSETYVDWINSQGEPDIDYVYWLEEQLKKVIIELEESKEYHSNNISEMGDGRPQYHEGALDTYINLMNKISLKSDEDT